MGLTSEQASGSGHNFDCLQDPGSSNKSPPLRCPRCDSDNTKFCYYNNYNRLQPRHFCKACRRYWTAGGTLRSVPVGGARKSKQPKTTSSTTTTSSSSTGTTQIASATFTDTLLESTPFHDMYPHVLFYPPHVTSDQVGNRSSGSPLLPHPPLLVPTSSSSSHSTQSTRGSTTSDDALLHLMPDSDQMSTWLQDPPPLPASYYWNWWDDAFDSIAPGPDQPPASDGAGSDFLG